MADNTAPTFEEYSPTGFNEASGAQPLQNQANQIKTDDASLRQQAVEQYQPTFEIEQRSLKNQLSALIKSQTDDSDLMNKQYEQSVNTMMSKLAKRGLNVGATPDATTAALDKFRNEVMTQRQAAYNAQQKAVQRVQDTHQANYELNIQGRMAANRSNALASLNDLLTQIAQLQASSFENYTKYILAKKKHSGGGGRRRYGGSSSGAATTETGTGIGALAASYFAGSGQSVVQKLTVKTKSPSVAGGKWVAMTK